jgi:YVTN family beta-propeller protein
MHVRPSDARPFGQRQPVRSAGARLPAAGRSTSPIADPGARPERQCHAAGLLLAGLALAGCWLGAAARPAAAATAAQAPAAAPATGSGMAAHPASAPVSAGTGAGYHLVRTIPVGGEGGWDYLSFDSGANRLYISRGSHVMVLDAETGRVAADIPNLSGVHGIALAADLGRGFISNGRSDTVTVFDLKTSKVLAEVKSTGQNPDAIIYDPASHRAFAFNGRGGSATAIDGATAKVAGTVALGGKPEFAASDRKGSVFVNIEDKNEVVQIDAAKLTVTHRWPLAGCDEPSGMAIDAAHGRLVIGCGNEVAAIVDTASGRLVAKLPIGKGVDANGFDPGTGLGFASCGDGTLTVLREESPDSWVVAAKAATQRGARTMTVDEKTHNVYLVTADFGPAPAPTADQPHPRPAMVPGTFRVLVVGP